MYSGFSGYNTMRILILDGLFVYKDLPNSFDNQRSIDIIYNKAKRNKFDRFVLIQNGKITNIPEGIKNVIINDKYPSEILNTVLKEAKNSDDIMIYNVGNPFYDSNFIEEMFLRHNRYIADYTYCIGYSTGLVPEIIRKDIIKELINLSKDNNNIIKDYIFQSLSKDINSFDIETILSHNDIRIYRTSIGLNDRGEEILTDFLYNSLKEKASINDIVDFINDNPHELFTTIYSLILELTNFSTISSIYYPKKNEVKNQMDINLIKRIIENVKELNKDIQIILGGIGEPLEHDRFIDILKLFIDNNLNVIIETTGYNISDEFLKKISNLDFKKITFVLKYDAYDDKTYKIIHPEWDLKKITDSLELLKKAGIKTYKQVIRMTDNEVEIEKFIRKKEVDDLIIRKYSTFCEMIPDKKVVDLAPLDRIPCYHLRRELFIRSDGKVPVCIYSRFKNHIIGDTNKDDLASIINNLKKSYIKDSKKEYLEFCKNCNDYYLFNF